MKRRLKIFGAAALLLSLCLLSGCSGKPIPEEMDEETVLNAGREIVSLLNAGEYQEVYDRMWPAGQETSSVADIQAYMEAILEENGPYTREKDAMVTGFTLESGEETAIAVLYCKHQKHDVRYRVSFSTTMELTGLDAIKPSLFG